MKKLLEANVAYGSRRISQVFADFCELSAIAIRNAVDHRGHDDREARYMQITGGYSAEEVARFGQLLAKLTQTFEGGLGDHLGELYMSLDLGSDRLGQYFTPFDISRVIAKLTIGDYAARLADRPFIRVAEPACGSGGMIIALADALREVGVNYQQSVHVTAQDLDPTAVHMTYIQLSLLHIPAAVVHGDTLRLEQRDVWLTPAHVLGDWHARLALREASEAALKLVQADSPADTSAPTPPTENDEDRSAA